MTNKKRGRGCRESQFFRVWALI